MPYHVHFDLRDSPGSLTFAKPFTEDSPDSPTFTQPFTRQTRPHLPKAIFEKNVTCLDKFARVTRESREFGTSGGSLVLLHFY